MRWIRGGRPELGVPFCANPADTFTALNVFTNILKKITRIYYPLIASNHIFTLARIAA